MIWEKGNNIRDSWIRMILGPTLVPDGILRGVDLRPLVLFNPGQSCSSSHLGSFTGSMAVLLGTGATLHHLGLTTV